MSFLEYIYHLDFVIMGIIGFFATLYAIDRMFTRIPVIGTGPSDDVESKIIKILSIIAAVLAVATPVLFALERIFLKNEVVRFNWLPILLFMVAAVMLLAKPLRDIPGTAIITIMTGIILFILVIFWVASSEDLSIFGFKLPLWLPFVIVFAVLVVIFIAVYVVEKQIDALLDIVAWSPFLLVIGILMVVQALLMILYPHQGIQALIG